jgi:mRNA interferase HigB
VQVHLTVPQSSSRSTAFKIPIAAVPKWDYDNHMRILSLGALRTFYETPGCGDAKAPLLAWHGHTLRAVWREPADVKADFGSASILKEGRIVFNIGGNKYRLVTSINYPYGIVFIKFIGTHKQYDAIDAQTI